MNTENNNIENIPIENQNIVVPPVETPIIKNNEVPKQKKKNPIIIIIIFIFLLVVLTFVGYKTLKSGNKKTTSKEQQTIIPDEVDELLKKDYYSTINKELFLEFEKDVGKNGSTSTFTKMQGKVDDDVQNITKKLMDENENMKNLYDNFLDFDERNRVGMTPLQPYIDLVFNSNTIEELITNATYIEKEIGVDLVISSSIQRDPKDNKKYMVYLADSSGCSTFNDINYESLLNAIDDYNTNLLKAYGYSADEAKSTLKELINIEKNICQNVKTPEELTDLKNIYNPTTIEEIDEILTNIDAQKYYSELGLTVNNYNVIDKTYLENYNKKFVPENLELLKKDMLLNIIGEYALYSSKEYLKATEKFEYAIYGGNSIDTNEDKAYELLRSVYNDTIEENFINEVVNESKKKYVTDMIEDILSYYKETIKDNDWLTKTTKEKALNKLNKISIYVGGTIATDNTDYKYSFQASESLIDNLIQYHKIQYEKLTYNVNNSIIPEDWPMTILEVNAYYYSAENAIYFPASIMYFIDNEDEYYENLGKIGMIIAHEISHAFDSHGAEYDADGNMNNWWQDEDYDQLKKRQQSFIDYYGSYKTKYGFEVNGTLTLSENIADLSAVNCITEIANKKGASKEDYRKMYAGFASDFAAIMPKRYEQYMTLTDDHAPSMVRVNATLSSIDKFYEVYDIKETDAMYVKKEDRISMW